MSDLGEVSLDDACARRWDVVVIGAGPAGSVAALRLARQGFAVLQLESKRLPRRKVCGGCLNARAIRGLEDCGLGQSLAALGASPLERIEIWTQGRSLTLPLPGGLSVTRETLDLSLARAAAADGARLLMEATAEVLPGVSDGVRKVAVQSGETSGRVAARVVVAADGLGRNSLRRLPGFETRVARRSRVGTGTVLPASSKIAKQLGLGAIRMVVASSGYVGFAPAERGCVIVAAALDPASVRAAGSVGEALVRAAAAAGFETDELRDASWRGTSLLTSAPRRRAGERLFLIGDGAGYVEPFTGEGMAWAIEGAMGVEPFVEAGVRGWTDPLINAWESDYQRRIRRRQWVCRGLAGWLRHPRMVAAGFVAATRFPRIASALLSSMNSPATDSSSSARS